MTPAPPAADPDVPPEPPPAQVHRSGISLAWIAPILALVVVLWLTWHVLSERGPQITVHFTSAEGLVAGDTEIRHKGVHVGIVESLALTPDMSAVVVHARMTRAASAHLRQNTRFWIVSPRVGTSGISGLNTLVSGSYIEMYPGDGPPTREFTGLAEPPVLQPDIPGRSFTLTADELGAIGSGTPLTYRGISVGQIEGYALAAGSTRVNIYAFVRTPYDRLVHPGTRFWDASAIDVSAGPQGIRVRLNSLQQLVTGAVAFDTPAGAAGAPSPAGSVFKLYDSESAALREHTGPRLAYSARFFQDASLEPGTPVELRGSDVGEVIEARLTYDPRTHELFQAAKFEIDPSAIRIQGGTGSAAEQAAQVRQGLAELVRRGLRAQLITASLLTGQKMIALDFVNGTSAARGRGLGAGGEFPTAPAADIDAILKSLQDTLDHINGATAGPQLGEAITSLNRTLGNLQGMTHDLQGQLPELIASLRATATAAQNTLHSADALVANGELAQQLPQLLKQLNLAAQSVRELADYLDRHPEALLRGRPEEHR
ncbi:MAG TPA: MlaD family protein [Steroidobacteraceae bacterium]|nr:MlaD family protein [Steroidobacteraceae bacterium]